MDRDVAAPLAFQCTECGQYFGSRNQLFRHLRLGCRPDVELPQSERLLPHEVPSKAPIWSLKKAAPKGSPKAAAAKRETTFGGLNEKQCLKLDVRSGSYQQNLDAKVEHAKSLFDGIVDWATVETEVFDSPPSHFRAKAEFASQFDGSSIEYVMFDGSDRVVVEYFPMGTRIIADVLMPRTREVLREEEALRQRLFQINFHATQHGDAVVSLLYRSPMARVRRRLGRKGKESTEPETNAAGDALTDAWEAAAKRLHAALDGASIVGRIRGKKRVVGRDWVEERLAVRGVEVPLRYRQLEGFFSQPNPAVAQHMLSWARAVARGDAAVVGEDSQPRGDDLLELYCGNGNFTVALAPCFRRALGTELVKALVHVARVNAEANVVANVDFVRISSEDLLQAMDGVREYDRLAHLDFARYDFRTVLVDPPRAGLGPEVSEGLGARFERIVYISCNPGTCREDLDILSRTHRVQRFALFDQFPYTHHLEMGVLLVRRSPAADGGPIGASPAVSLEEARAPGVSPDAGRPCDVPVPDVGDACCIA